MESKSIENNVFFSLNIEREVLSGICMYTDLIEEVASVLTLEDFFDQKHREIYKSILYCFKQKNILSLSFLIEKNKSSVLQDYVENIWNKKEHIIEEQVLPHAKEVFDYSIKRKMYQKLHDLLNIMRKKADQYSPEELIGLTNDKVNEFVEFYIEDSGQKSIGHGIGNYINELKNRRKSENGITGLSTGIADLDRKTNGLQPGELILIAGRPSMGKTTISLNILENIGLSGQRGLMFSIEMPEQDVLEKMISSIGEINYGNLRNGAITEIEKVRLKHALERINQLDIIVDDTSIVDVDYIRKIAYRAHKESPLSVILVDYLQLMEIRPNPGQSKSDAIGEVTRGLKLLAKSLKVPIVLLSQLNRDLEKRPDKRPINSDLRDSGSIEQDADVILFVYRDVVYNQGTADKDLAEIIISKQRRGAIGTVYTHFKGMFSKFKGKQNVL